MLVAVEGEDAEIAEGADAVAAIGGGEGFAGVFDDAEVVFAGKLEDGVHVAGETEDVNRKNGADAARRADIGDDAGDAVEDAGVAQEEA